MSVHLDIGKRYRNHRDNVMTDEDISQRKQGEMRSSTRPCKRGLDKVWIAQAERLEGDLGNNWSLEAWAGTQLPSIDLPAFPDPGSTVNLARIADVSWLIICVYSHLDAVRAKQWGNHAWELAQKGYRILAVSADTPERQRQWASNAQLKFSVVSDSEMCLERLIGLSTAHVAEKRRIYENVTLVIHNTITKIFPAPEPQQDAARVIDWIGRFHADD